jgi:secretion/DNA translocation related TadE-like protein
MNRSVADSQTRVAQPAPRGTPVGGAPWRSGRRGRSAGERGGATLVGLALTGFVLLAGLAAVDIGALAVARAAAQTAADMAALAALTPREGPVAPAGGSAETRAAELAGANGAELVSCDCSAVQAVVRVRRRQRLVPAGLTLALTASARAVLSQPPAANRATVRAVDHSRAADGSQAKRPRDPVSHGTAGRPARERERRDGGGAVRRFGRGGSGSLSAMCRRSALRSSGSGRADCSWR